MEVWAQRREGPAEATSWGFLGHRSPSRARTEVIAEVRDELRAPLLGLEALLDTLAGRPMSEEVTERMQGHSRALARRVTLLIEDLALVTASHPGAITMDMGILDLDRELSECADSFPDMTVRVEGDKGLQVRGDALRVQQICAALVRNVQRLGGRPVTIHVSGKSDFVALRVADAGPRDGYELSIVKTLVRAHAGMTIHEVGGPFTFTLPRATSAALPVSAL